MEIVVRQELFWTRKPNYIEELFLYIACEEAM